MSHPLTPPRTGLDLDRSRWCTGAWEVGMRRTHRYLAVLVSVGLVVAAGPATGAAAAPDSAGAAAGDIRLSGLDLDRATVLDLQHSLDRHQLSSVRLTGFYL